MGMIPWVAVFQFFAREAVDTVYGSWRQGALGAYGSSLPEIMEPN